MIALARTLALVLVASVAPAQEGDLEAQLYRGFYQEVALRDFEAARAAYAKAAEQAEAAGRKDVAVKARLGLGRALRSLAKTDEARAAFEAALRLDPGNAEARAGAEPEKEGAPDADAELNQRLRALVAKLGTADRPQAVADLALVGARAAPYLTQVLQSRDAGTVQAAAGLLVRPEFREALARALPDPNIIFPQLVVGQLVVDSREPSASAPIFEAALSRPEPEVRIQTIERLCSESNSRRIQEQGAAFAPFFLKAWRDIDPRVRQALLGCAWEESSRHLVPVLREALSSKDAWERERAVILSFLSIDELRPELERTLADPEEDVRAAALDILTPRKMENGPPPVVGGDAARDVAARMLLDPSPKIARLASELLAIATSPLTPENTLAVVEALRRVVLGEERIQQGIEPFLRLPQKISDPDALAQLYALVGSPKSILERNARWSLRKEILDRLLRLWTTPSGRAEGIARHLPDVPDAEGKTWWLRIWREKNVTADAAYAAAAQAPEPEVRREAYKGLLLKESNELPPGTKLSHLAEDLVSKDPELQSVALTLAERFPDPTLTESLRVRVAQPATPALAVQALALSAGREALPQLREVATSSTPEAQKAAMQQILRLLGDESLDEFLAVARKTNGWAPLLADLRGPLLEKYVERLPDDLINAGVVATAGGKLSPEARVRLVRRALQREDSGVLFQAAQTIDMHQLQEFAPDLLRLLESPHQTVRERAKIALQNLREYRELRAGFEQYGEKGRAGAVVEARGMLRLPDPVKRRGAALALGALGDPGAVPALLEALGDADATVRDAAMQALERLGGRAPK